MRLQEPVDCRILEVHGLRIGQHEEKMEGVESNRYYLDAIFILSFKPVCVTIGSLARLIYVDGNFSFVFNLP